MKQKLLSAVAALTLVACGASDNQSEKTANGAAETPVETASAPEAPGRTAGYNPDKNAYFGDLHIHTRNSFDAYIFNVRRTADDAYRFAKGETVPHPSGFDMTIDGGPLDFYAVTDHAEYLGILPAMNTEGKRAC